MIEVKNVYKSFKHTPVLSDVSLTIEKGEVIGLVGGNGAGKSVLLNLIAGLLTPDQGVVMYDGKVLGKDMDFPENTGVMINEPGYVEFYTGFQNLFYLSLIQGKIGKKEIEQTMRRLNLDPNNKTMVKNYSSGMKVKLGIAQAIMENQDILILDEPFNALDHQTYHEVHKILSECKAERKTIIMTAHNHRDIEKLCTKVYFLERGKIRIFTDEIREHYFNMN